MNIDDCAPFRVNMILYTVEIAQYQYWRYLRKHRMHKSAVVLEYYRLRELWIKEFVVQALKCFVRNEFFYQKCIDTGLDQVNVLFLFHPVMGKQLFRVFLQRVHTYIGRIVRWTYMRYITRMPETIFMCSTKELLAHVSCNSYGVHMKSTWSSNHSKFKWISYVFHANCLWASCQLH